MTRNPCVAKAAAEKKLWRETKRPNLLMRAIITLSSKEASRQERFICALAVQVARQPPLDRERLRASRRCFVYSSCLVLSGAGCMAYVTLAQPEGVVGLIGRIAIAVTLVMAAIIAVAGKRLRDDLGLPEHLVPEQVDEENAFLEHIGEAGRPTVGPVRDLVARTLLTFDAGLLLFLSLPALLPTVSPMMTTLFAAGGALVVGKLMAEAVRFFAHGVLVGLVRRRVARLFGGDDKQQAQAERLRAAYASAEGGHWPLGRGLAHGVRCYSRALGWAGMLMALLGGLVGLRIFAGGDSDMASLALVGGIASAALVLAAADSVHTESLTQQITQARLVAGRFNSGTALSAYLRQARDRIRIRLLDAERWLNQAAEATHVNGRDTDIQLAQAFDEELDRPVPPRAGEVKSPN